MTRADGRVPNYQSPPPPASAGSRVPSWPMPLMTRRVVAMLMALAALLLSACGGAEAAAPPQAPPSYAQGGYPGGGANDSRPAPRAPAKAAQRDRDSDGIPSEEPAPAADAPKSELAAKAPPPPPPVQGQPPGEKKNDTGKDKPADGSETPHETSMLIYTARVTMAVYQVDQGLAAVEKLARDNGGYLALKRDREITIRVPRNRFEPTLAAIDKIGDVLHRDVQAQDVTDEFVDTEIRIRNARAMQVRLKALLDKANVKEALEIEKELRRVTEELELLEGKLKLLKDKIAYSTITVAFEPRGSTIQTTRIKLPFPWLTRLGLPALLQLQEDR